MLFQKLFTAIQKHNECLLHGVFFPWTTCTSFQRDSEHMQLFLRMRSYSEVSDSAFSTFECQQRRFTASDGFDASWNPYQTPCALKKQMASPPEMCSPTPYSIKPQTDFACSPVHFKYFGAPPLPENKRPFSFATP